MEAAKIASGRLRNWEHFSGPFFERWSNLTEADLAAIAGERGRLIQVLEERYPRSREVIEREVAEYYENIADKLKRDPDVEV